MFVYCIELTNHDAVAVFISVVIGYKSTFFMIIPNMVFLYIEQMFHIKAFL